MDKMKDPPDSLKGFFRQHFLIKIAGRHLRQRYARDNARQPETAISTGALKQPDS
ncbi:hypothetical protein [Cohnella thermotolerans]|uniref:hypothetical protein n=1 Tax=Cohnella thermotolerans TaxID=329858 RepID=UPI00041E347A|nr:hypothetical protein [Cohnella thermotolerans]